MMYDKILEEKELRVADAKRKLAWVEEENQELRRMPLFKEYFYLRAKRNIGLTEEEQARITEILNMTELFQLVDNDFARDQACKELRDAVSDLQAYRKSNIIAQGLGSLPIQNRAPDGAAASKDTSPKSVVHNSDKNNQGEMEMNFLQPQLPGAELRQRRRGGNLNGRGDTMQKPLVDMNKTGGKPD